MDLNKFPDYYKGYKWNGKHKIFGYAEDSFPDFSWISSLEKRFLWLKNNSKSQRTASKYLIQEMIEWGGSQNGVLQKFNDQSGEVNFYDLIQEVINNIANPEKAIASALNLPGMGLTYASKLLRFMDPGRYGALDSRIRSALIREGRLSTISDGNTNSMVNGYVEFVGLLNGFMVELRNNNIKKPHCGLSNVDWRPSEIEMALFCWAERKQVGLE